jgi:hypothetical protein
LHERQLESRRGPVIRIKKTARRLLAGAVLAGTVFSGAVFGGGAGASTAPVVYAAHNDGWHAYTKPGSFYFGN